MNRSKDADLQLWDYFIYIYLLMLVFFINGNLLYLLIRSCLEPLVDSGEQDETLV